LLRAKRENWYQCGSKSSKVLSVNHPSPQHPEHQASFFGQPAQSPVSHFAHVFSSIPRNLFNEHQGCPGIRKTRKVCLPFLLYPAAPCRGTGCHCAGAALSSPGTACQYEPEPRAPRQGEMIMLLPDAVTALTRGDSISGFPEGRAFSAVFIFAE